MLRSRLVPLALGCALALAMGCADSSTESPAQPENAARDGYTITHLVEGSGAHPKATDTVLVHYHGTFPDGGVFDSSVERGEPARFPLNRVIPCWTRGVAEMKVGGKAKLECSPKVAYGERGAPPRIPPNATLHFEVELLEIL